MEGVTTLRELRLSAIQNRDMSSAFEWLQKTGLVPDNVTKMRVRQVLTDLDPEAVSVEYLAAAAYEWDSWGPASPVEFVKAIGAETRGSSQRDLIMETLTTLGRQSAVAAA